MPASANRLFTTEVTAEPRRDATMACCRGPGVLVLSLATPWAVPLLVGAGQAGAARGDRRADCHGVPGHPALRRRYADATGTAAYTDAQHTLVLMALYHVIMIGAAAALSVFKPGRIRRRASRR